LALDFLSDKFANLYAHWAHTVWQHSTLSFKTSISYFLLLQSLYSRLLFYFHEVYLIFIALHLFVAVIQLNIALSLLEGVAASNFWTSKLWKTILLKISKNGSECQKIYPIGCDRYNLKWLLNLCHHMSFHQIVPKNCIRGCHNPSNVFVFWWCDQNNFDEFLTLWNLIWNLCPFKLTGENIKKIFFLKTLLLLPL
jgi:hypothetical protein